MENIELNRRTAHCSACARETESNWDLPFFEYRGTASVVSTEQCKCGYAYAAHPSVSKYPLRGACEQFRAHGPYDYDLFYCGCRGWD
jgi:hypothetical protein